MSFNFDDLMVGGQLKTGQGLVPAIGEGNKKINGSMYAEGPIVFGTSTTFPTAYATVNLVPYQTLIQIQNHHLFQVGRVMELTIHIH